MNLKWDFRHDAAAAVMQKWPKPQVTVQTHKPLKLLTETDGWELITIILLP